MMITKIMLTLLSFYSLNLLASPLRELQFLGFDCQLKTVNDDCQYQQCVGKIAAYPRNIAVLLPIDETILQIRVHFHGHVFRNNVSITYDRDLATIIDSAKMGRSTCEGAKEAVIVPASEGNCADFDNNFKGTDSFTRIMNPLLRSVDATENLPLHFSAHSGGGRTIRRIITDQAVTVDGKQTQDRTMKLTYFDAFYSDEDIAANKYWLLEKSDRQLRTHALVMNGSGPYDRSQKLAHELGADHVIPQVISNNSYSWKRLQLNLNAGRIFIFDFEEQHSANHWSLVEHSWPQ